MYGLLVEIVEYSSTETPAQYLWEVRLQIPQVTGSSTPVATSEEQIVQGGLAGQGGQAEEPAFPLAFDLGGISYSQQLSFVVYICHSISSQVSCIRYVMTIPAPLYNAVK